MGGTTPAPSFRVETVDDSWSDDQLGALIAECMSSCSEFVKFDGWNNPRVLDRALNEFGYKSYADLRRNALWVYVEGGDNAITIYPCDRHGTRSPTFEGLKEVVVGTFPKDLGRGIRTAIALSS